MNNTHKDDKELCKLLRENSLGASQLAAYAVESIESLAEHLDNVDRECKKLEAELEQIKRQNRGV